MGVTGFRGILRIGGSERATGTGGQEGWGVVCIGVFSFCYGGE